MNDEKIEKIISEHPLLYREVKHLSIGDGWFELICRLSKKLENLIIDFKSRHPDMPEDELPCAMQVKQKYGTLRFYMSTSIDKMEEFIEEAEGESARTCEVCGNAGELTPGPWLSCLCEEHYQK